MRAAVKLLNRVYGLKATDERRKQEQTTIPSHAWDLHQGKIDLYNDVMCDLREILNEAP